MIDKYALQFEIEHLKTPVQAFLSKEGDIARDIERNAILQNEKKLSFEEFIEKFPQFENSNMIYRPYESVINYYKSIESDKWLLNYYYSHSDYFTNFNIIFVLGIFFIWLLLFIQKKYKNFIKKLENNEITKNEQVVKTKKCPYCSEIILSTAKKCKHRHSRLNTFDFIKSIKFNKCVYYSLIALIALSIINNILLFIHPIIIYSIFSCLTLFDPIVVLMSFIFISVVAKDTKNNYKVLGVIGIIILSIISFVIYREYIANMWSLGRLTCLLLSGFCFNTYIMKIIKDKFERGFVFFFLYFLFTLFASSVINYFYEPIKAIAN